MVFCIKGIHLWHSSHHLFNHFLGVVITNRNRVHLILLTQVLHDVIGTREQVFQVVMEAIMSEGEQIIIILLVYSRA